MTGKDKSGKFHPPKGKPSGSPKKENLSDKDLITEASEELNDADQPEFDHLHIRHHNRYVNREKSNPGKRPGNGRL